MAIKRPQSFDLLPYELRMKYIQQRAKRFLANPDTWINQLTLTPKE